MAVGNRGTVRCPLGDKCPTGGKHFTNSAIWKQHNDIAFRPSSNFQSLGSVVDDFSTQPYDEHSLKGVVLVSSDVKSSLSKVKSVENEMKKAQEDLMRELESLQNKYDNKIKKMSFARSHAKEGVIAQATQLINSNGAMEVLSNSELSEPILSLIEEEENEGLFRSVYGEQPLKNYNSVSNSMERSLTQEIGGISDLKVSLKHPNGKDDKSSYLLSAEVDNLSDDSIKNLDDCCYAIYDDYKERGGTQDLIPVLMTTDKSITPGVHSINVGEEGYSSFTFSQGFIRSDSLSDIISQFYGSKTSQR